MSIGFPEQDEAQQPNRARGSYWGGLWLRPDPVLEGSSGRLRFGAREIAIAGILLTLLLLLLGAMFWVYGPLPQLLPVDCKGCFISRP